MISQKRARQMVSMMRMATLSMIMELTTIKKDYSMTLKATFMTQTVTL